MARFGKLVDMCAVAHASLFMLRLLVVALSTRQFILFAWSSHGTNREPLIVLQAQLVTALRGASDAQSEAAALQESLTSAKHALADAEAMFEARQLQASVAAAQHSQHADDKRATAAAATQVLDLSTFLLSGYTSCQRQSKTTAPALTEVKHLLSAHGRGIADTPAHLCSNSRTYKRRSLRSCSSGPMQLWVVSRLQHLLRLLSRRLTTHTTASQPSWRPAQRRLQSCGTCSTRRRTGIVRSWRR